MANETGITNIAAVSDLAIGEMVQRELKRKGVIVGSTTDYSFLLNKGNNAVGIPRSGSFVTGNKVENTPSGFSQLTPVKDTINLDIYPHIVVEIEDDVEPESHVAMFSLYQKRMISAFVRRLDSDLYTSITSTVADGTGVDEAGNTLPDHTIDTAGVGISRELILDARQLLDEAEADEARSLVISPADEAILLNIADFIDASKYGNANPIQNGEIGRIYGIPVLKTNLAVAGEWSMYTKEHVGHIQGMQRSFETRRSSLTRLATEMSLSSKYGVGGLQLGRLGVFASDLTP
jgi:hypothetical protein